MTKTFLRALLTNLSLALVVGGLVLMSTTDLALVEDGHLTNFACYLLLGALAVGVAWFWRFDRQVSRGDIDQSRLPYWLRDDYDPAAEPMDLRRCLAIVAALVVVLLGTVALAYSGGDAASEPPSDQQVQIEEAIRWYSCWRGEVPAGAEPTHALVTYRDGEPNLVSVVLGRDIMRHPDENPGMVVHALCP